MTEDVISDYPDEESGEYQWKKRMQNQVSQSFGRIPDSNIGSL
jgi:hypothetical protein